MKKARKSPYFNAGNGYKKLTLKDREWTCPICRMPHIRDWNAAVNILEKGLSKWQNPKIKKGSLERLQSVSNSRT